MSAADAVVIGAGIIGLTTATRLAERGATTVVVTADEPTATTSVLATAMVGPTFGFDGPDVSRWEAETVRAFTDHLDAPGVHINRGRFLARAAGMIPPTADQLPGFALVAADELPQGYDTGFWAEIPLVDMRPYLTHLTERFERAGGTIQRRYLSSLDQAFQLAPRVANCSGLGARTLVPDPSVTPSRGPKIIVENPGIDAFVAVGPPGPVGTMIHPHGDIVVLGGSATTSDATTPDPAEAAAVIERCAAIEPSLRDARILEHRVGLRPQRPTIRLDRDERNIDDERLVHNYGHGGIGVTVSWGTANDAARLLLE